MRDLRAWLKEGDPLEVQSGLSADDARRMRQVIVSVANESRTVDWSWPRPVAVAATVVVALGLGVAMGMRLPLREAPPARSDSIQRTQIQFETPGGTRVVWVLNSEFKL